MKRPGRTSVSPHSSIRVTKRRQVPHFVVDPVHDDESIASSVDEDETEESGFLQPQVRGMVATNVSELVSSTMALSAEERQRSIAALDPTLEQLNESESSAGAEAEESLQARRLRIARAYLQRIGATEDAGQEDERSRVDDSESVSSLVDNFEDGSDNAEDALNERLYEEAQFLRGQYVQPKGKVVLEKYTLPLQPNYMAPGHKRPPTCIALLPTGEALGLPHQAITGGKDGAMLLWDLEHGSKRVVYAGQTTSSGSQQQREILCIAASRDGRLVATGSRDACIRVYDLRQDHRAERTSSVHTISLIDVLRGHRAAVTGIAFFADAFRRQAGPNTSMSVDKTNADENLFSASFDRTLRLWSIERTGLSSRAATHAVADTEAGPHTSRRDRSWQIGYVDSYHGHDEGVTSLCCSSWGRLLSGGRDRTVRAWKVYDDTQLVFRAPRHTGRVVGTSIDCVAWVAPNAFVSGADDCCISLWSTKKKKPVYQVADAHASTACPWICALSSPEASNLVCSGSSDGCVRLWSVCMRTHAKSVSRESQKMEPLPEALEPIGKLPYAMSGFCNGLDSVQRHELYIAAAIGQEHRLGKWHVDRKAPSGLAFWRIPFG
ncbi:hypothetical protein CCYA_CCYA14G3728 [Cyanidiococcus yangmingshanensis]|nr:hypothetical protein CCYA_CCYA14G3728 [Cyanidiococcus yangmingshanensis]